MTNPSRARLDYLINWMAQRRVPRYEVELPVFLGLLEASGGCGGKQIEFRSWGRTDDQDMTHAIAPR